MVRSLLLLLSLVVVVVLCEVKLGFAVVLDFEAIGGVPGDDHDNELEVAWTNGRLMNDTLQNVIASGDTLVVPQGKVFLVMGGIEAYGLVNVTIQIDGELKFSDSYEEWPRVPKVEDPNNSHADKDELPHVLECIKFYDCDGLTLTSQSRENKGVINGNGNRWWNLPFIGYLRFVENRPRLLATESCNNTVVENLLFVDSPYWTTKFERSRNLVIRHSAISARRTKQLGHGFVDLSAFNTDGFDFTGRDIHVHDVQVWSQDDCIAVKDDTQNVLVERVNISGVGLTIGSIGSSLVKNVTFRDSYIMNSHKGIYLKFRRGNGGLIEDVTFDNIVMDNVEQYPIWIGPAQQSDTRDLCYANPCSICYPMVPGAICNGAPASSYRNILLSNIRINRPAGTPGVILGGIDANGLANSENITFHNVRVDECGDVREDGFEGSFSDLPTKIYDPYVTDFILIIVGGILLFAVVPCAVCCRVGCCTRTYWKERPRGKIALGSFLVLLLIGGVMILGWFISVGARTGDKATYFECSGVTNGVATGDTWPVPSCFDDQTTNSGRSDCGLSGGLIFLIVFLCLAAVTGGVALFLKKKQPETYQHLLEKTSCCCGAKTSPESEDKELLANNI